MNHESSTNGGFSWIFHWHVTDQKNGQSLNHSFSSWVKSPIFRQRPSWLQPMLRLAMQRGATNIRSSRRGIVWEDIWGWLKTPQKNSGDDVSVPLVNQAM